MKAFLLILTTLIAIHAHADFLSLPVNCRSVHGINNSNTDGVTVNIRQHGDGLIVAIVKDGEDSSRMICQHSTTGPGLIECKGIWTKDGSPSHLKATMNSYVPFITILRSEDSFKGATDVGVCIEGN